MTEYRTFENAVIVEFEDQPRIRFDTVDDVFKWAQDEKSSWNVFSNNVPGNLRTFALPALSDQQTRLDSIVSAVNEFSKAPPSAEGLLKVEGKIQKITGDLREQRYICSKSELGKSIIENLELDDYGSVARFVTARRLHAKVNSQAINSINFTELCAAFARAELAGRDPTEQLDVQKKEFRTSIQAFDNRIKAADQALLEGKDKKSRFTQLAAKSIQTARSNARKASDAIRDDHNEKNNEWAKFLSRSENEIGRLKQTYDDLLKLKVPAGYWRTKKRDNLVAAVLSASVFVGSVGVAIWGAISFWPELYDLIPLDDTKNPTLITLAFITLPVIGFGWAMRIFTKVFAQSLAQMADASQREKMVLTYLALAKDESANLQQEERLIILNALFRPSESHGSADAPPPNLLEVIRSISDRSAS